TADGRTAGRPTRVGYRVVRAGPPQQQAILAAPQLLADERVRQQQEDLVVALILASVAGLAAAVCLAGLAGRGLARPVAALRDAAIAVGRGAAPPGFAPGAPREFAPVMSAFERMAADVRRSQAALEEARRRTAQVLANVATGVIAVDDGLRVPMANARAARGAKDFAVTLEATAGRILAEIDRLDAIARAFARFASPVSPEDAPPLEPVDLQAAAGEVVQLYALGGKEAGARVEMVGDAGP